MTDEKIKRIVEAALLAADTPLKIQDFLNLFDGLDIVERPSIVSAIADLKLEYQGKFIEISEVASGYRMVTTSEVLRYLKPLWELKPQRLSRALYETLALIAYRQPITRGEIEEIRGVAVSTNIIKILFEREWIKIVGHKDTLGRPGLLATTKEFLDDFNLATLSELPPLEEIQEMFSLDNDADISTVVALPNEATQNIH
jgi:segregation and condensation protein B